MAENVGGIVWTAEMKTELLISAQKIVESSMAATGTAFEKAAKKSEQAASSIATDSKKVGEAAKASAAATVAASTEAIAAYNKMQSALQSQRDGIAQYIAKLKEQNETLGLSAAELAQYQAAKLGASERDKQIVANLQAQIEAYNKSEDAIRKNQAALAAAEAEQADNKKSVQDLIAGLREYEKTVGMTTQQLVLYKAAQKGATTEDLAAIKTQLALIAGKERQADVNTQLTRTSVAVSNSLSGVGRNSGQAAIQLQQFVGQIQGGVNPMIALSQQSADLGFVLGAPLLGAVVGISASIASIFIPALFKSTDAAGDLEKALAALGEVAETTDDGITVLTKEIQDLANVSELAARGRLTVALLDAEKAAKAAALGISEAFENSNFVDSMLFDIGNLTDEIRSGLGGSLAGFTPEATSQARRIGEAFGVAGDEAVDLGLEVGGLIVNFEKLRDQKSLTALRDRLTELSLGAAGTNKNATEFLSMIQKFLAGAQQAVTAGEFSQQALNDLAGALKGSSDETRTAKTEFDRLTESLKFQAETAGMTEQQIAEFVVRQLAAKDSTIDLDAALKQVSGYYERIKAAETLTQKTKEQEQELNRAKTAWENLSDSIAKQSATAQGAAAANQYQIEQIQLAGQAAGKTAEEIQKLVDAQNALFAAQEANRNAKTEEKRTDRVAEIEQEIYLQQIRNQLGNEQFEIESAIRALGPDATPEEQQAIADKVTQLQALRFEYELLGATIQESMQGVALNALDNFSSGLARVITEGDSAREMFGNLAKTIATELLTAIIRYWVGQAAAALVGQTAVTAATVTAGGAAAAAWAPAATLASIATLGGAATIGVAALGTGLTAGVGLAAASQTGSALTAGAGRKNGGPVNAGMIYPVSEGGDPELLMQGGRSYLLPGAGGGNVVSAKDMQVSGGGGNAPIINITNYSGGQASVQSQRFSEQDKRWVLDVVVGDMNKRGATHKAVTGTTNAVNRTS